MIYSSSLVVANSRIPFLFYGKVGIPFGIHVTFFSFVHQLMGSWVVSILDVVSGAVMTMGGQMSL
jgi:hypothetical protein